MTTFISIVLLLFGVALPSAAEYFGVKLGQLRNSDLELNADVYAVNKTHLQVANLKIKPVTGYSDLQFFFLNKNHQKPAKFIFEYNEQSGSDWLKEYTHEYLGKIKSRLLVIEAPGDLKGWSHLAIGTSLLKDPIAQVSLNGIIPAPFCCIHDGSNKLSIVGEYGVRVDPIEILDAKTIRLPNFNFQGTKPPDGWIFTGKGEILQHTGQKALILGRDVVHKHCAIHEDYYNYNMTVRLAAHQTVYDIEWISVFCYQYEHDFGSISINMKGKYVPPFIPQIRTTAPQMRRKIQC